LIAFTAMRPDLGLSNGREVSLLSVAWADVKGELEIKVDSLHLRGIET
jgi:hypothetical protein